MPEITFTVRISSWVRVPSFQFEILKRSTISAITAEIPTSCVNCIQKYCSNVTQRALESRSFNAFFNVCMKHNSYSDYVLITHPQPDGHPLMVMYVFWVGIAMMITMMMMMMMTIMMMIMMLMIIMIMKMMIVIQSTSILGSLLPGPIEHALLSFITCRLDGDSITL